LAGFFGGDFARGIAALLTVWVGVGESVCGGGVGFKF
jgi:hypothetical protein